MELSILIPARNEMFLAKTIENILENIEADTEVIAVLDGAWADPAITQDPRVTVIYHPESVGQRAATNEAARLARGKYVMKVDAHCAFDKGFDRKMLEAFKEVGDNVTMIPIMYNLHAFDWVCPDGHRRYQGPSGKCEQCGKETTRDILWKEKRSPESTAYRFDQDLHFQYWGDYKKKQKGDLVETMSIQGSCFMCTKAKYFELNICDEKHGSWGQQGTEVACKTWLSGGRVLCNKRTWYAHMFRTQGGDFGFPYPNPGIEKARKYSQDLWKNNKWDKAIYPLSWLINKFSPVPEWPNNKGIIFYTDNQLNLKIAHKVQRQLRRIGLPIVSASLKPMPHFGDKNIHVQLPKGYLAYFTQILRALEASTAEIIFFCEHDVLYHPSHFDFTPPRKDKFYYNRNFWKLRVEDGHCLHYDADQVSGMCCYRELAVEEYRKRLAVVEKDGYNRRTGHEPGTHDNRSAWWKSEFPNVDIRHDHNLTKNRWKQSEFRNKATCTDWIESDEIPGWGKGKDII